MTASDDRLLALSQPVTEADADRVRFRRQWVISRRTDPIELAWPSTVLNDRFELHHHPDARILRTRPGKTGCLVIGVPLTEGGTGSLADRLASKAPHQLPGILREMAGTYVLIHFSPEEVTVFTDPAGMMGVFRGHGRVASTPPLLGRLERDGALDAKFPFKPDNDWYPGDLTPFRGVTALLPNHFLRLDAGVTERFWPREDAPAVGVHEGTERLAGLIQRNVVRTIEQGSVICSVTGGKDSRVNVAALRRHLDTVGFFTVRQPSIPECDLEIPRTMARTLGLDHRFVDSRPAEAWLTQLYDEMTHGQSIGGRRSIIRAANDLAGPERIHLNGTAGGLAKGHFWHSKQPESVRPRSLAREFVHKPPVIRAALDRWLDSVPDLAPTTVYNLMFLEQRAGRWASVGETASNLFYDSVTTFCSRQAFELICGLPVSQQYDGSILVDLVSEMWPELAELPYCRSRRYVSRRIPRPVKSALKSVASSFGRNP